MHEFAADFELLVERGVVLRQQHAIGRIGHQHGIALLELQPGQHFRGQYDADRVANLGELEAGHRRLRRGDKGRHTNAIPASPLSRSL